MLTFKGRHGMGRSVAVSSALALSMIGVAQAGAVASDTPAAAVPVAAPMAAPPVAFGPQAALFTLKDSQGNWFDTGTDISGTRSLAAAVMPTANPGGLLGDTASVIGQGALSGADLNNMMNLDMAEKIHNVQASGAASPTYADLGVDIAKLLNLDTVRSTAASLLPVGDTRLGELDSLISQFVAEVSTSPADKPLNMLTSPSGSKLMALTKGIRAADASLLPVTINFDVNEAETETSHFASAIIWPDGAEGMPFDQAGAFIGSRTVQLTKPGLYAFACKVHPYMLGAVAVDDPLTPGVDFGSDLRIKSRGMNVPSYSDIVFQLVQKFFVITNPGNWQHFSDSSDTEWNPGFAPAPLLTFDQSGAPQLIMLETFMKDKFSYPTTLKQVGQKPATPGVGQVWFDTQMERYAGKTKSGAATMLNAETWSIDRKIAAPEINMNNPHNMWTDKNEKYIYQTEWFSNMLDVFDRQTGKLVRRIEVGPGPTHVMTRTDTDQMHVALGGGGAVMEVAPGATRIDRRLAVSSPDELIAHPHAHWMSGNAKWMATPNVNLYNASLVNIKKGTFVHKPTGEFPIATGMNPTGSKTYMADFLGASISCFSNEKAACIADDGSKVDYKKIDLWNEYDPISGASGNFGGLGIQIAVAPDNSGIINANTLTSNLTILDPKTDKIVAWLPCHAGCHGVNFGAKKGGGYYAYITSKFANVIDVIDIDPNGDGNPSDAAIVGSLLTDSTSATAMDDSVTEFNGFGGQGVMTVPLAYEGWVQNAPKNATNNQLTCKQRNPVKFKSKC
ncbi:copper oxidase [Sporichthya sp.]|uniref:copper oxidase n=1 Tax=Sporichthya sp. TaxID=65475 RepID=UPI0025EE7BB7|nr:copper oxidase [Sporichthya sp.]